MHDGVVDGDAAGARGVEDLLDVRGGFGEGVECQGGVVDGVYGLDGGGEVSVGEERYDGCECFFGYQGVGCGGGEHDGGGEVVGRFIRVAARDYLGGRCIKEGFYALHGPGDQVGDISVVGGRGSVGEVFGVGFFEFGDEVLEDGFLD